MTTTESSPKVLAVVYRPGIAGQYAYRATIQYPTEGPEQVTFVGSVYGGPIVMLTPGGAQVPISCDVTDRIGSGLSEPWVRAFFAPRDTD